MADINSIEDLKHSFNVKPGLGEKLPNPKDTADKASFFLKSATPEGDTWVKHKMVNGVWYKEVVRASDSAVVLQKV